MTNLEFSETLIRGKITEIIFEMMFRSEGYKITHFGYEYIAGEFVRDEIRELKENEGVLKNIRNSPDFIVTDYDNHIRFVEVKLQSKLNLTSLREMAKSTYERWSEAWYFVATKEGFYYCPCEQIIKMDGELTPLSTNIIPEATQYKYLEFLRKYLPPVNTI
jgi:hypothetical protein